MRGYTVTSYIAFLQVVVLGTKFFSRPPFLFLLKNTTYELVTCLLKNFQNLVFLFGTVDVCVDVTDEMLQIFLTRESNVLPANMRLSINDYYQTPWFARYLRETFRSKSSLSIYRANPWRNRLNMNNDTFVHVRLGDLADTHPRMASDYTRAIGTPSATGKVFISSDSVDHDIVRSLVTQFNATLLNWSKVRTIQFGSTCAFLVLSDGSFSWTIGSLASINSRVRIVPRSTIWTGNITHADWQVFR